MRVRMRTYVSGSRDGVHWPPVGAELELDDAEGAELCAAGIVEPVAVAEPVETATPPAPEQRAPARPATTRSTPPRRSSSRRRT